jgi:hypothetical protein
VGTSDGACKLSAIGNPAQLVDDATELGRELGHELLGAVEHAGISPRHLAVHQQCSEVVAVA